MENVSVVVKSNKGNQAEGLVSVQTWDQPQRMKRALKTLGICWGLMIATIFVPVLHFILVPAFFLAGPIASYILYQQTSAIKGGVSKCPDCGSELPIAASADRWPLNDICTQCRAAVTITRKQ